MTRVLPVLIATLLLIAAMVATELSLHGGFGVHVGVGLGIFAFVGIAATVLIADNDESRPQSED